MMLLGGSNACKRTYHLSLGGFLTGQPVRGVPQQRSRVSTRNAQVIHRLSTSVKRDTSNGLRQTIHLKVSRLVALLQVQETGTSRHDKR